MLKRTLSAVLYVLVMSPTWLFAQVELAGESQTQRHTLLPGDVVRLTIWREPGMSGDFQVDEAGVVVFPRLGERSVLDHTPESLQALLID
jgi:protein involved in polysaccharide export with SLBB domain